MGFRVAVVGATGNVGREFLTIMAERNFPADDVVALASNRSAGREVSFGEDDILRVQALDTFDFRGIDIVLSSAGSKVVLHVDGARIANAAARINVGKSFSAERRATEIAVGCDAGPRY